MNVQRKRLIYKESKKEHVPSVLNGPLVHEGVFNCGGLKTKIG
jgi:hypothetical protein